MPFKNPADLDHMREDLRAGLIIGSRLKSRERLETERLFM